MFHEQKDVKKQIDLFSAIEKIIHSPNCDFVTSTVKSKTKIVCGYRNLPSIAFLQNSFSVVRTQMHGYSFHS